MIGLMLLGAGALYFGLMFFVMRWTWRAVRADGGSVLAASTFAFVGFLLFYLPVFWNHIPVLLAHRSMCAKDAGFKAYVTPEQWIALNKNEINALVRSEVEKKERNAETRKIADDFDQRIFFGGLLFSESKRTTQQLFSVDIGRAEMRTRDVRTGKLLASYTDYSARLNRDDIKGWIFPLKCPSKDSNDPNTKYSNYRADLRKEIK